MGGFVAYAESEMRLEVLLLAIFTTVFLQVLSNLANDFGDFVKGTDNKERLGPERSMQSGAIDKASMKRAIIISALLSLLSGLALIYVSLEDEFWKSLLFLLIGILAILSAIRYTIGTSAYGYSGWGDVFVFIFFGWVAVAGTYYLNTLRFDAFTLLPASTLGFFSSAVLNLNNLRDHKNDKDSGKRTLVVKMGFDLARYYHLLIILAGWSCFIYYLFLKDLNVWAFMSLITIPLFARNIYKVFTVKDERKLDPELKFLALSITLFTLLFGIGLVL